MRFDIISRWTGKVQFTAEIECDENAETSIKLGLAVKVAVKSSANLSDAYLRYSDLRAADLRGANLRYSDLSGANLSGADLRAANLSGADLRYSDLRGANLSAADLRDADLRGANLSGADLRAADLRGANLRYSDLSGANLRYSDLSGANLSDADLSGADLRGANLSGADLRGAPIIPNIHQAVYEAASAPGALDMSTWHNDCGTAHCRAGWVVMLAGDEGKKLEAKIGTPAAAAAIYLASDPKIGKLPDFYCDNKTALSDMKARAEAERGQ